MYPIRIQTGLDTCHNALFLQSHIEKPWARAPNAPLRLTRVHERMLGYPPVQYSPFDYTESKVLEGRWGGGWIRRGWNFAVLGRPDFQSRGPETLILKGLGTSEWKNRGAPEARNLTTTDPTSHSQPSENNIQQMVSGEHDREVSPDTVC